MSSNSIPFNKVLRKSTRDIHSISDALVNSKLAFALSSNKVWAEGLLVFYEIFKFLEEAMSDLKETPVGKMYVEGMKRTETFESDLNYYLGKDWNKDTPRPAVLKYLDHLTKLRKENSNLLIAYIYHLYMGLFSGGQILRKKRMLMNKLKLNSKSSFEGESVTTFDKNIYNLKCEMVSNLNNIATSFDEETRQQLIEESRTVFQLNNEIINTIKGTKEVIFKKLLKVLCFIVILLAILFYFYIN